MSLQTRLGALITAIGADVKSLQTQITGKTSYPWTEETRSTTYNNSTVTPSDVFTGFSVVASGKYEVEALLMVTSAAITTGVQVALAGPTSGITRSAVRIVSAAAANSDLVTHTNLNTFQTATAGLTSNYLITIQALMEFSATPGAQLVRVRAQSEVAASQIQVFPGSYMRWRQI